MHRRVHEFLLFVAALLLVVCVSSLKDDETRERKRGEKHRSLVTNPVTTPSIYTPNVSPPPVDNIPSINPTIVPPNPATMPSETPVNPSPLPVTNPVTTPSTNPGVTNPVTTPSMNPVVTNPVTTPSTNPGMQPVTNPGSSGGLPGTVPVSPPLTTNDPAAPGQSWCVAKSGSLEIALQSALDYACNIGGVDCSAIQKGASCYNPNSLEFHASYAFNSYYMKNPDQSSCDFGGTAMITNTNPSSGSCIFPTASSSTSLPSPVTQNPTNASPTPTNPTSTPGVVETPPFTLNSSNPTSGIPGLPVTGPASRLPITDIADSPPGDSTSISMSSSLHPLISGFTLVISILTGKHLVEF
ncbi:hypothetical protein Leryth_017271 [Lithospermum erythrorhizon]|nr:hypothetical protein Leryth_017271 [Lithospermum erythrorhizon]